jgi:signal transduction histidine kinase
VSFRRAALYSASPPGPTELDPPSWIRQLPSGRLLPRVAEALARRRSALGLQQRIMLYVTLGLLLIFASVAVVGLKSIQQATALVYQERLSRADTIASILTGDFRHVSGDVREERSDLSSPDPLQRTQAANRVLDHLGQSDTFSFFSATGVWVMGTDGRLLAAAGAPPMAPGVGGGLAAQSASLTESTFQVLPPVEPGDPNAFGSIVTRLGSPASPDSLLVIVHAEAANTRHPYLPGANAPAMDDTARLAGQSADPMAAYHLEVVGPDGRVALGIGADEHPGALSYHFPVIQRLADLRQGVSLLHQPGAGNSFEPHIMSVVPLPASPYYLVLEQAVDVALALPNQLEQWLVLLTVVGFLAVLVAAWITTSRVVRPTRELTAAARRMAQGDLESPIRISAQDEVGRLAQSLESMRRQLGVVYQQLEDANLVLESQVRERTAQLTELLEKIISAQEDERARLARELHDETAQTLGALTIALDRARDELAGARPRTAEQLAEARTMAARLMEETRRLILDLRPMALDDLGLAPAIRWYAETHLEEQGVEASVEVDQPTRRLPKHIEVSVFRIVQEAVNNIVKHAHARRARIRLVFRDWVAKVVISDDGQGFEPIEVGGRTTRVRSVGLLGMQERVRLLNGHLRIRSIPGRGTTIAVRIPIAHEAS